MTVPRYSTWRFVHPDFDVLEDRFGFRISRTGGIEMVHKHESLRQAILVLLSTRPGERVMRPDYGCDLNRLMFMPNDATTHGLAIHYISRALTRWEPRIDILLLDADSNEIDPARVDIVLEYRVRSTGHGERLSIAYNLMGSEA